MPSVTFLSALNALFRYVSLKHLATGLIAVALCACGGGDDSPPPPPASPTGLTYPAPQPYTFIQGAAIAALLPSVTGTVTGYTLSSALPGGLSLDATTGMISGTPTVVSPRSTYTITASNAGGSTSVTISVAVNFSVPANLSYPAASAATVGTPITTLTPTVTGTVQTWSVAPALPSGLTLSATTGAISGMPVLAAASRPYTITAENAAGSTSFDLTLVVNTAPPLTQADANIGECLNMGDHLEAPNEGDWGRPILDSDFTEIRARGFETVRIPVRFSNHALRAAPYTIDAAFLTRVEHVVDTARAAGLRVILDMHHYSDAGASIFADPQGQAERFKAMWTQIAERFKGKDPKVWFELLHEPQGNLDDTNLLTVFQPALDAIRVTNPARPVVIGGQNWSNIDSLKTIVLPSDPYVVATFHYYDSYEFTHQGAPWVNPRLPEGRIFPEPADTTELAEDFLIAKDFIASRGKPLILGEYGAYQGIPEIYRSEWYKQVHDGFKAVGVRGCAWAYTATMHFRDPGTGAWIESMLKAVELLPRP